MDAGLSKPGPNPTMTDRPTVAEAYAARHGGAGEDRCHQALFWRGLYLHAWPVALILGGYRADFFNADREFICDLARLTRFRDFGEAAYDFASHTDNRRFTRRWLRLRVSSHRLRRQVRQLLHATGGDSHPPHEVSE
jgi:hypothetical protein